MGYAGKPSAIPSRGEIIKDLIKWFATEWGLDIAEAMFAKLDTAKLIEMWKQRRKPKTTNGGGGILLVLAFLAFGKRRRR